MISLLKRPGRGRIVALSGLAVVAVAVAGVVTVGLLRPRFASATGGQTNGPAACQPPAPPSAEQLQQAQHQFATQLAQALGKPEAQVEQALADFQKSLPKPPAIAGQPVVKVGGPDPAALAPIAAKLGVTPQELVDAMQAAAPPPITCNAPAGQAGTVSIKLAPAQLFAQVAQHLGRGITADQVQAAFESDGPPKGSQISVSSGAVAKAAPEMDAAFAKLAAALGVTVDQLKAAFDTVAQNSGCPAPPPPGEGGAVQISTGEAGLSGTSVLLPPPAKVVTQAGSVSGIAFCMRFGP